MSNKHSDSILEYCKRLADERLLSTGDSVSVRVGDKAYKTKSDIDLAKITSNDIEEFEINNSKTKAQTLLANAYMAKADVNAIIINHAPHCVVVAKYAKKIPPVLDDMAQIIGPSAKIAPSQEIAAIIKTLKGRNACLIRNAGAIATGRTLDEAFTASLVLEKGAKTFIEGEALGGAKPIPYIEALLMHFIYKKKYSKKDQDSKLNDNK